MWFGVPGLARTAQIRAPAASAVLQPQWELLSLLAVG